MTTYLIRDINRELWGAFKDRCTAEGHTLRWVLLTLMTYYIQHGLPGGHHESR